jgi:hypothetical protein
MAEQRNAKLFWHRWTLDSIEAMATCHNELNALGRIGQISAKHAPDGTSVWLLEFEGETRHTPVLANMGMVVVLFGDQLRAMTKAEYANTFRDNV